MMKISEAQILRAERRELLSKHFDEKHRMSIAAKRLETYETRLAQISDELKKLGFDR